MPQINSNVLVIISGATSFRSCAYKPGATKAQTWYRKYGNAITNAAIIVTFIGTKNGAVTSVAISCPPVGIEASIGCASNAYRSRDHGNKQTNTSSKATTQRNKRSRSSIRCDMKESGSAICDLDVVKNEAVDGRPNQPGFSFTEFSPGFDSGSGLPPTGGCRSADPVAWGAGTAGGIN